MDKKNLIAFLSLSLAVLIISQMLFPAPKPKVVEKPAAAVDANAKPGEPVKPGEPAKLAAAPGDAAASDAAPAEDADAPAEVADAKAAPTVPLEYASLGSLDRETGYRMLVTLTNQGAAVKRAELSSPRFLDLTDRTGYLGHLEFEATPDGLKVGAVGAGTPAALAGLQVGDVITSVQRKTGEPIAVKTIEEFEAVRTKTRPNQDLTLSVTRTAGSQQLTAKLARRPLEVMRPEIENITMRNGVVPPDFIDPPSFLASITTAGGLALAEQDVKRIADWLEKGNWQLTAHDATSVTFERPIPSEKLKLIKRYTLEAVPDGSIEDRDFPGYNLKLDVEVQNTGDALQSVAYRLDGPTGLPLEGWWYAHKISQRWFSAAGLRDVVLRFQGNSELQVDCSEIAKEGAKSFGAGKSLAFVGVDAVYFSTVFIPVKESLEEDWFDNTEAIRVGPLPAADLHIPVRFTNVSCRLTRKPVELAPGASQKDSYVIFIGPKRPSLLAQYKAADDPNYSLKDIVYYGMFPFGAVARGMLSVLHFFYSIVGNFGIAIIMLTVLVRGCMFPVSFKQTQNMARMQALKPELDRINEKYKGDMQKRSAAMQDVYRKHKINPLGGCLPVVLQLPIFIGLYRSIMVDVELRQAPLFGSAIQWCSDLAAPDMLYNWSWLMPQSVNNGEGIFGLGPYFNLLPIITVVLFLVSMKMSMPEPTNEQGVMQQKMMKYMTGFMGLMFYKVASGLCLYFIASSLWGLGERRLLKKTNPTNPPGGDPSTTAKVNPPPRDPSNGTNGSWGKPKRKR